MIAQSANICPARLIVLEFNFILICFNLVHLPHSISSGVSMSSGILSGAMERLGECKHASFQGDNKGTHASLTDSYRLPTVLAEMG